MDTAKLKRNALLAAMALLAAALTVWARNAEALPVTFPDGAYGNVQLAAATATQIPATPTKGRSGIAIYNNGSTTIFCGTNSSVTASNGLPILPNGSITFGVSYSGNTDKVRLWCFNTAGQTSPADTRWMEVL